MIMPKLDRAIGSRAARLFCVNQGLNAFATRGFDVAIVWLTLTQVESATGMGLVLFLKFLPYAAFGLLGGWLGDRLSRWRMIAASDLMRGALLVAMAWSVARGGGAWSLGAVSFLFTTCRTISQPASQALVPDLVDAASLGRANAWLHGAAEATQMIAPAAVGLLLTVAPPWVSPALLAVVFAGAAAAVPRVGDAAVLSRPRERLSFRGLLASYRGAVGRTSRGRPDAVLSILVVPVAILGVGGLINFSIPDLLLRGGGFPPSAYGMVLAAMSLGTLPGAFLSGFIRDEGRIKAIYGGWLAYGASLYLMGQQSAVAGLVACAVCAGAVGAVADISFATHVQGSARREDVSKLFAVFSTLANGCEALSAPMMAFVVASSSIRQSFVVGLLLVGASCLCGLSLGLLPRLQPGADRVEDVAP